LKRLDEPTFSSDDPKELFLMVMMGVYVVYALLTFILALVRREYTIDHNLDFSLVDKDDNFVSIRNNKGHELHIPRTAVVQENNSRLSESYLRIWSGDIYANTPKLFIKDESSQR